MKKKIRFFTQIPMHLEYRVLCLHYTVGADENHVIYSRHVPNNIDIMNEKIACADSQLLA